MDITPLPNISWNCLHYLMTCLFKMLCCMFTHRRVTTTYMTANKTHPKRNYREMFFFTFFTILSIWTNFFFFRMQNVRNFLANYFFIFLYLSIDSIISDFASFAELHPKISTFLPSKSLYTWKK